MLGIFVPVLPTTPLLLLSAACFARSSDNFYHRLMHNRWFGKYLRNYKEGKGVPLRVKIVSISLLWVTIGLSAILANLPEWVLVVIILIAIAVSIHIIRIAGKKKDS
jgi:uncharacterized membrane protein YbaN (DUF454 family)